MAKRVGAVVLGAFLFVQGGSVVPAAQTAPQRSLIYCGWFGNTIPTPAFIAANRAFLETQPFHGLVTYLRNDSTGFNATTRTMTTSPISATELATLLTPLRTASFSVLRENFGLIQGSTPPDFFDDWTVVVQNFATVAKALRDAGLRGVVFDNEQYFGPWGNYPDGVKYGRSLAEYQAQARLRGKQVMEAMIAQCPEIAVLTLHGPTVSEPKAPGPLFPSWWSGNELLGPFFAGMMEGTSGSALNVDGGELYSLRSAADFLSTYNWRKFSLPSDAVNCAFIPPALRPSWAGKSSIGYGVYDRPFGGASMDSTILRTTIANALRQADRYVWFYTEGATFLRPASQGGASAAWVDAVRNAIADAGSALPPPSGPAAPTHLAAAALSSSTIDLSWWDMSNNETAFEIERKTGSTGTWGRVLTTGANVSTIDDIGLGASTTCSYRVRAVNSTGASAYSNEVSATTAAPPPPAPAAPTHFAATVISSSAIDLSWWDMSNNETAFELYRKTGAAGTWTRVLTTGANISTIDDVGLTPSTTYFYRSRAVNGPSASGYSNEVSVTTPAPPPAAPIKLTIQSTAHLRISVTWWDMSNNETAFEIQRKTGSAGAWLSIATRGANISIFDDWTVQPGVFYVYRVRALGATGASAWTNEISATAW